MSASQRRALAIALFLLLVGLGYLQSANVALGVSDRVVAWLGLLAAVAGAAQSFLPPVQRKP